MSSHETQVRKHTCILLREVINGEAGDQAHVVEDRGVNRESAAILDLKAFFSAIPRCVGGCDFAFTLQNYAVSFKDDFWGNGELRFIWELKEKV